MADTLVFNRGENDIKGLRIALPYDLVTLGRLKNNERVFASMDRQRKLQSSLPKIRTAELAKSDSPTHWAYHICDDVKIVKTAREGWFEVERTHPGEGRDTVGGFVKWGWEVDTPNRETLDRWSWTLCALRNVALFDMIAPSDDKEYLHGGEKMWLRLELNVPPTGYNRKGILELVFAQSREFTQTFRSPGSVTRYTRNQISSFVPNDRQFDSEVCHLLNGAKENTLAKLPPESGMTMVWDWRTLLYREYGLAFESVQPMADRTVIPIESGSAELPPSADPPGARRFPIPKFLQFFKRHSSRSDRVYMFEFGAIWEEESDEPYADELKVVSTTKAGNASAVYVLYVGFVCGVAALILNILGRLL